MYTIILISALSLSIIMFLTYFLKYKNIVKKTKKFVSELETNRKGYYTQKYTQTTGLNEIISDKLTPVIYSCDVLFNIREIERYKDDISKIELISLEIKSTDSRLNKESVLKSAKSDFLSLKKTSDIKWLEIETTLKEQRKVKLNQLKELLK